MLALLGDIAPGGILSLNDEKIETLFQSINEILSDIEVVIANYEFPVVSKEKDKLNSFFHCTSEISARKVIRTLNLKVVSIANNHILDHGIESLKKTIAIFEEENVLFTGAGYLQKHLDPITFKLGDWTVGFLACVDKSTNISIPANQDLKINFFNENNVLSEIAALKKKVDKIILSIHWGNDYSYYPTKSQLTVAEKLCDTGVDIILGHHPHTIQPFSLVSKKYIFYSLGQLCFGDFMWKGQIRAIRKKTKKSFIPFFDNNLDLKSFINTYEKKGNEIITVQRNIQKWSSKHWFLTKIKHRYKLANWIINFKEKVLDRIFEYFFGYYRNPFIQLFSVFNIRKSRS